MNRATPEPPASEGAGLIFDDPLARQTSDDTDEGWGERRDGSGADDLDRFLQERPPHHL